jgi:16S rRNA C1402 N4-methylase RsmH
MHFTVEAQNMVSQFVKPGDIAIDATAGNGFDTLFLTEAVGESGTVYAVDIQPQAIEVVRQKLRDANRESRCQLMVASHAQIASIVPIEFHGRVAAAMFNLGYLPFGDKSITTRASSTIAALDQVLMLLKPNGLLCVLAYLGHDGGTEEANEVSEWILRNRDVLSVEKFQDANNQRSPILWKLVRSTTTA